MVRRLSGILLLLVVAGCGFGEAKRHGEQLADRCFAAAQRGDTASVLAMYDDAFYRATPKATWQAMYTRIRSKLGRPQSHTLTTWRVNSQIGTSGDGEYVTLVYQVRYESAEGTETIGVFIPSSGGHAGIRSHHFNSDALIQ